MAAMIRPARTLGLGFTAVLCVLIALYAVVMLSTPAIRPPLIADLARNAPLFLTMHMIGGAIAIAVGTFQLSTRIRARNAAVHRWLGRAYVIGVLVGGVGGLMLSFHSTAGLVAQIGFFSLAVLWLASTIAAYVHIRNRRVELHRKWMIRSYALTLAALTLRIMMPLSQVAGLPMVEIYPVIAWLCWVPNLVVAEWFVLRR